jgi:hypothetical protein
MKYTPGPWTAEANGVFKDKQRNPIASVYDPEHTNHLTDIAKANAQLIAAAPEMYEALKAIIESGVIPYCYSDKLVVAAKQALAKAEGEED